MGFFLFVGIFVGIFGHGWELFWLIFVTAVAVEVLSRLTGKSKLKKTEAKLETVMGQAEELIEIATKSKNTIKDLREEIINLQDQMASARREGRKAGMRAAFDQYLDARQLFDQNLEVVIEHRRKERDQTYKKARERFQKHSRTSQKTPDSKRPWWVVLGVDPKATALEIKTAYRNLAMQFHPDRSHDNGERMAELNVAKEEAEAALV